MWQHYTNLGVASGTGSSVALAFAKCGCQQIYLGDTTSDELQACRDSISKLYPSTQVHVQEFDRSNEESVDQFFKKACETLQRIDFAVNVVSQAQDSDVPTGLSIDGFDRNYHIYQRGVYILKILCGGQKLTTL